MRQSEVLEAFKQQQHAQHALHAFFDLDTGFEILSIEEYGHLQVGTVKITIFLGAVAETLKLQNKYNHARNGFTELY